MNCDPRTVQFASGSIWVGIHVYPTSANEVINATSLFSDFETAINNGEFSLQIGQIDPNSLKVEDLINGYIRKWFYIIYIYIYTSL